MEEKTWTVTLEDGTLIENLERNGDCFITDGEWPELDFVLATVTASADGEADSVWTNARVIKCASVDGRNWFAFRELSAAELKDIETQAQIEYLALMTDVDLEEM